jgi:hypothetical protein
MSADTLGEDAVKKDETRKTLQKTGAPAPKKPYEPPRVVSHNALEIIAATCTPSPPGKTNGAECAVLSS